MIFQHNNQKKIEVSSVFIQDSEGFYVKITDNHSSIGGQCKVLYYVDLDHIKHPINLTGIFCFKNKQFNLYHDPYKLICQN